jgi:hypothetical protein
VQGVVVVAGTSDSLSDFLDDSAEAQQSHSRPDELTPEQARIRLKLLFSRGILKVRAVRRVVSRV